MGHIIKKILNDVDKDPNYENLTIEYNSNKLIHIHWFSTIDQEILKKEYIFI